MKNWNDLKYFLALAREGSISAASKSLEVNYSTVSRRLNAMEESISTRLFERQLNGYELTEAGQEIYEQIRRIETSIDEVHRKIMGKDQRLDGTIRIVTTDLLSEKLSVDLRVFLENYPNIELEVVTNFDTENVTPRDADIVLQITDTPPDYMVGRKLCDVTGGVYCSTDYLNQHSHIHDPVEHRWIDCPHTLGTVAIPEKARAVCRITSGHGLREAVKNGLGVANLWNFAANDVGSMERLPGTPSYRQGLWLLIHKDLCRTTRFKVFKDYLEKVIRSKKNEFEIPPFNGFCGINEAHPIKHKIIEQPLIRCGAAV